MLETHNYTIYGGLSWNFDFTFYWEKNINAEQYINDNNKIYIHISSETTKDEIKKEVNKLLKISDENKKYILVKNIDALWIMKTVYDNVEIVEINDFLKKFSK
jgi:hypothetical protein